MKKIFAILLLAGVVLNAQAQFEEGKHYVAVKETASAEPKVTEFFSLFCGHCYQFEGMLAEFKAGLKKGTKFEKSHVNYIPRDNEAVSFGMVKAFLVIGALGKDDTLIPAFFDHIHQQRKSIETEDAIKAIFVANGVSEADFSKHYNDPKTATEATQMIASWKKKGISNVPTLVINDKYRMNMGSVSSIEEMIKLTNFLLEKK